MKFLTARLGLTAACLALSACGPISKPIRGADPSSQAMARSVWIEVGESGGFGSGVVIETGFVVTNYHVIDNARGRIIVDGQTAQIAKMDQSADLALLACNTRSIGRVRIASKIVLGERVFYVGNPGGLRNFQSRGQISEILPIRFNTTAWAEEGFSGSGVYNLSGQLVGINVEWVAHLLPGKITGNSIRGDIVKRFLNW